MNVTRLCLLLLLLQVAFFAISDDDVSLQNAFPNFKFVAPVHLTHSPDSTDRLFVVEQLGEIHVFPNNPKILETEIFLDLSKKIQAGGQSGMLGLAFHPDFKSNGYFFVNYTIEDEETVYTYISRFTVLPSSPNKVDPGSEVIFMKFPHPYNNLKGGSILFGSDGYLYISTGDGGNIPGPQHTAQDKSSLYGKILRIDVDNPEPIPSRNEHWIFYYGIPNENPFAGNKKNYREEIFAYGIRNVWKFTQDRQTGMFWAGDPGEQSQERIIILQNGKNYGWHMLEDTLKVKPPKPSEITLPVYEYQNTRNDCAIIGGYVYRGKKMKTLKNYYIYGDFCSGKISVLKYENNQIKDHRLLYETPYRISSFGEDQYGEMYVLDYTSGIIFRLKENP